MKSNVAEKTQVEVAPRKYMNPVWRAADRKRYDALMTWLNFHGLPEERTELHQKYQMARSDFEVLDQVMA